MTELTREMFPATPMGTRVYLGLMREGYRTVEQVRDASDDRLLEPRNLGAKALVLLRQVCGGHARPDLMPRRVAIAYRLVLADLADQVKNATGYRQHDLLRLHETLQLELDGRVPSAACPAS